MPTKRLERNWGFLKLLAKCTPKRRCEILSVCDNDLIKCIDDCSHNILKGNIPIGEYHLENLKKHKKTIREVSKRRNSLKKKRDILVQNGGSLPALLIPILTIIGAALSK